MTASQGIMAGKKGLVMGVANDHSLAWAIAQAAAAQGAEMAFTYQGDNFGKRVKPLVEQVGAELVMDCDVSDDAEVDAVFAEIEKKWGRLHFLVHAIAYSDRAQLKGRYVDTTRENFAWTMDISCYSFTALANRAAKLMEPGGSMLTLTYNGSRRVMPSYNVMGVAKAALEASVRYLAVDLGRDGIRVNALSPGPMRTLAGAAIGDSRTVYKWTDANAPLRRNPTHGEVGGAGLYLLSDLSAGVTGEVHFVDCGYNVIGMIAPPA